MELEIYNPKNRPVEELPVIYGFNNGGSPQWYNAVLVAQDGTGMGSHVCSHEGYIPGDLGLLKGSRPDRHEGFREHYPDGYRMEYVPPEEVMTHPGLDAAVKANQATAAEKDSAAEVAAGGA